MRLCVEQVKPFHLPKTHEESLLKVYTKTIKDDSDLDLVFSSHSPPSCLPSAKQLTSAPVRRFPTLKMYGLYLEAVNDYINESYGEDVWRLIENRAEIPHLKFVRHQMYK